MLPFRRFFLAFAVPFFFACGFSSSVAVAQQEGTFVPTGSMASARFGHSATLLNNGMVLVAGGWNDSLFVLASAELYDPAKGAFTPTGSMASARFGHSATLLNNGKVLIAGGLPVPGGSGLSSAELYDPATGTFTPTGSMASARSDQTATLLNNGKVLISGGGTGNVCLDLASAELYDSVTGTFTPTGNMTSGRVADSATLLNNGQVLVAGGLNCQSSTGDYSLASSELYDPATGTFTPTGSMTSTREGQTATLLNNGKVLVAGGQIVPSVGDYILASAELYDPSTGTFTTTASMSIGRARMSPAPLLNNGEVFVSGGQSNSGVLASAELYELVVAFPTNLLFSAQFVATTSAAQTVTVTNNQSSALSIASIVLSGTNVSDFAETDNCVGDVAAVASCAINVTFTPTASGTRAANLNIANNISGSPLTVPITGTGVAVPLVSVSVTPSSIVFPSQYVGTSGLPQSVTVTNNGDAPLSITSTTASPGDFGTLSTCGSSLGAGASCTIGVFFDPTASGARNGTLTINDNGPNSPQTVALSGAGQDFSMASPTPTATVAAGQTATYPVSLSSGGGFSQTVSLSCTGAPALSTCSVSPSSVTLNGTGSTPVTVSVSTTAPALVFPDYPRMRPPHLVNFRPAFLLILLLTLELIGSLIGQRRETKYSPATVFPLVLLLWMGITLVACGGGGSVTPKPGTQAGTYALTVSGTFSSGPTTLAHNTKLTLVVQ